MTDDSVTVVCPTCGKEVEWTGGSRYRPFCSDRCRLIDLGEWASERYRVPGEPGAPPDAPDSELLQ